MTELQSLKMWRYLGLGERLEFGHKKVEKAIHMKQIKMSSSVNSSVVDLSLLVKNETVGMVVTLKWDKINSRPASASEKIGSPSTGRSKMSWITYLVTGINFFLT